ncbi:MAG: hypothetical protein ACR2RF_21315 [Geminicoccaceae bacterium]
MSAATTNLGDPGFSLQAHHCQWAALFNLGLHDTCYQHIDHGIALYDAGDYRDHVLIYGGHDPAVCGLGQAASRMKRALSVAESLSRAGSILHATEIALMFHRFRQDVDEVEDLALRMIALSREEEFAALEVKGQLFEGWAQGRRGQADQAVAGLTKGINALRSIDASEDLPFLFDILTECCALGGRTEDGTASA